MGEENEVYAFWCTLVVGSCVFFLQAEDGIGEGHVTGVQMCALPIWPVFFCAFFSRLGLSVFFFVYLGFFCFCFFVFIG